MEALLILLGLAIPVAWMAAFFMALAARKRLGTREPRFTALEGRLRVGETPAPASALYPRLLFPPRSPAAPSASPASEAAK